jgi:hypothetical protein
VSNQDAVSISYFRCIASNELDDNEQLIEKDIKRSGQAWFGATIPAFAGGGLRKATEYLNEDS